MSLRAYLQAIEVRPAAGHRHSLVPAFIGIANALANSGFDEAAAVLQGAADAIFLPPGDALVLPREETLATLTGRLGDDRLNELLARGMTMPEDEVIAYARTALEALETSQQSNN
jgi:hypothetical protein